MKRLWQGNAPLTAVAILMVPVLAANVVGLWLDPRIITGMPAWLKPAKFAVSIAIYCFTLAWIFTYVPEWKKTRFTVGGISAIVFVVEIAIINLQAWRGTTSHFNVGTPLDATLFTVMGLAIVIQTLSSIAVAVALWRQRFDDRALGWALRLGVTISILGGLTGGLMTRPTSAQLTEARATHHMALAGAHTVGAPDGGPGLPATGWSVQHGDVRVGHFVGLHAMQTLPIFLVVLRRRGLRESARAQLVITAALSYVTLFGLLIWQALRGQPVIHPDAVTLIAWSIWLFLTLVAMAAIAVRGGSARVSMPRAMAW